MNSRLRALAAGAVTLTPSLAFAGGWQPLEGDQANGMPTDLNAVLLNIINWILGFCAIIAVLVIIWGGVQYLTSTGNSNQTDSAKSTIKNALMGLVIIGIAYAIVNVIITVLSANG